jgi:hypothetical protein
MPKRRKAKRELWTRGAVLPVMGVLSVVAIAFGFQLGESAISQIDPLYFRGGAPIPQDVSGRQQAAPTSTYASASGWDEGRVAMAHDCGGDCPALRAREMGIAPSSLGIGEIAPLPRPRAVAIEPVFPEAPIAAIDGSADSPPPSRTNRYLHYPVSQEPEPSPPSYADPEPAPAKLTVSRGAPEGM